MSNLDKLEWVATLRHVAPESVRVALTMPGSYKIGRLDNTEDVCVTGEKLDQNYDYSRYPNGWQDIFFKPRFLGRDLGVCVDHTKINLSNSGLEIRDSGSSYGTFYKSQGRVHNLPRSLLISSGEHGIRLGEHFNLLVGLQTRQKYASSLLF